MRYVIPGLRSRYRAGFRVVGQACLALAALAGGFAADEAGGLRFFEEKIRPLLSENCFECHGPKKQKAELRLDARALLLKGARADRPSCRGSPAIHFSSRR